MRINNNLGRFFIRVFPVLAVVIAAVMLAGCREKEQIERYTVEKPPVDEADEPTSQEGPAREASESASSTAETQPPEAAEKVRLLGAIIARPSRTWFFKATGPAEAIAAHAEDFTKFVESIRFEDDTPKWDLVEGWREEAGGGMRLATRYSGILSGSRAETFDLNGDSIVIALCERLSLIDRWGAITGKPCGPRLILFEKFQQRLGEPVVRKSIPSRLRARAIFAWSINARAWRSASNLAITARVSMPGLIIFNATLRRTGRTCSAM